MKRLIALVVLLLLGFYVAWPAWTGYQIASALKAKDTATLDRKIAFPQVRETLKPIAVERVGAVYDQQLKGQVGPAGASIVNQIKADVVPKIVDTALAQLVTSGNLIRIVSDGGTLKQNAERILDDQVRKIGLPGIGGAAGGSSAGGGMQLPGGMKLPGGLGDIATKVGIPGIPGFGGGAPRNEPPAAPPPAAAPAAAEPASFGIGNIKRFGFLGPLAFEIGVAKDAAAAAPDVTVEMRFLDGDWRVVGVRPRI
jgi:hypothetical protein